jgi:hypothetical protein
VRERVQVDAVLGDRLGVAARIRAHDRGLAEMWRRGGRIGELRGELTEHQVLAALLDEAERRDVPEDGGAAVAEHDLPPVRQREQRAEAGADRADEVLDRRLAVRGAQHRVLSVGERRDLLGADLRRSATESAVGGQQVGGNGDRGRVGAHGQQHGGSGDDRHETL